MSKKEFTNLFESASIKHVKEGISILKDQIDNNPYHAELENWDKWLKKLEKQLEELNGKH